MDDICKLTDTIRQLEQTNPKKARELKKKLLARDAELEAELFNSVYIDELTANNKDAQAKIKRKFNKAIQVGVDSNQLNRLHYLDLVKKGLLSESDDFNIDNAVRLGRTMGADAADQFMKGVMRGDKDRPGLSQVLRDGIESLGYAGRKDAATGEYESTGQQMLKNFGTHLQLKHQQEYLTAHRRYKSTYTDTPGGMAAQNERDALLKDFYAGNVGKAQVESRLDKLYAEFALNRVESDPQIGAKVYSQEDIAQWNADMADHAQVFADAEVYVREITAKTLQNNVDAGMYGPKALKQLELLDFQFYVPRKGKDQDGTVDDAFAALNSGFFNSKSALGQKVYVAGGREGTGFNALGQIIADHSQSVSMKGENHVAKTYQRIAEMAGDSKEKQRAYKMRVVGTFPKVIEDSQGRWTTNPAYEKAIQGRAFNGTNVDNKIVAHNGDNATVVEFLSADLAYEAKKTWQANKQGNMEGVMGFLSETSRFIGSQLTGWNPGFWLTQTYRDIEHVMPKLMSEFDSRTAADFAIEWPKAQAQAFKYHLRGMRDGQFGNDRATMDEQGMLTTLAAVQGPQGALKDMESELAKVGDKTPQALLRKYRRAEEVIWKVPQFLEEGARMAAFRALKKNQERLGISDGRIAQGVKTIQDFSQGGTASTTLSAFELFWRPAVTSGQDTYRFLAGEQGKNKKATAAAIMGWNAMKIYGAYAIAKYAFDMEDEENPVLNASNRLFLRGVPIPLGDGDGQTIVLPIAYGSGMLGSAAMLAVKDFIAKDIGYEKGQVPLDSLGPLLAEGLTSHWLPADAVAAKNGDILGLMYGLVSPVALEKLDEVRTNTGAFGTPIARERSDRFDFQSGRASTPDIWKDAAEGVFAVTGGNVDINPDTMRYIGNMGAKGPIKMIENILKSWQIALNDDTGDLRINEIPVLGALAPSTFVPDQTYDRFFEAKAEHGLNVQKVKSATKLGGPHTKEELRKEDPMIFQKVKAFNKTERRINQERARINTINDQLSQDLLTEGEAERQIALVRDKMFQLMDSAAGVVLD